MSFIRLASVSRTERLKIKKKKRNKIKDTLRNLNINKYGKITYFILIPVVLK